MKVSFLVSASILCIFLCIGMSYTKTIKIHIPYNESENSYPRVKFRTNLPPLRSFTLCQWIKPYMEHREMFSVSYAVPGQEKEIAVSLSDSEGIRLRWYIGGSLAYDSTCRYLPGQSGSVLWISGSWYHVCILWTNSNARAYVNGYYCDRSNSERPNHNVQGNGVFVLGQSQAGVDNEFHANQSWHGDVAEVHLWDEVLTYEQIRNIGKCKGKVVDGNVISWMNTPMECMDGVIISSRTEFCDFVKD